MLLQNAREEDEGLIDYLSMLEDQLKKLREQKKNVSRRSKNLVGKSACEFKEEISRFGGQGESGLTAQRRQTSTQTLHSR